LTQHDRETAAELAERVKRAHIDPAKMDEVGRPPEDQPPKFADVLMSEKTAAPVEADADLTSEDWELIVRALEHYARSGTG
jgi:hypothetical protein